MKKDYKAIKKMLSEQEGKKFESLPYNELLQILKEPKYYAIEYEGEKFQVETDVELLKNGDIQIFVMVDRGKIFEVARVHGFIKKQDGSVCPL